ncbi:hypothetical protein TWF696_008677 [Orbilia brochopaga]|uniref:Transcription factor Iwr1 domain-containing protein n=1 Tax=Orbilia brochopaga TaxID=3140254 RepID=A0AAV9UKG6_9PEZI
MEPQASTSDSSSTDPYSICTSNLPNGHPQKPFICVHCKFRRDEVHEKSRIPKLSDHDIYVAICGALYLTKDDSTWRQILIRQFVPKDAPDYKRAGELVSTMLGRFMTTGFYNYLLCYNGGQGHDFYDTTLFEPKSIIARANFKLQRGVDLEQSDLSDPDSRQESDDESATAIQSDNAEIIYAIDPILDAYSVNGDIDIDEGLIQSYHEYENANLLELEQEEQGHYEGGYEGDFEGDYDGDYYENEGDYGEEDGRYYDYQENEYGENEYSDGDVHEEVDIEGVQTPGKRGLEHTGSGSIAATPTVVRTPASPPVIRELAATPAPTVSSAAGPSTKEPEASRTALAPSTAVVDMISNMAPTLSRHGGEVRITRHGSATIRFPRNGDLDLD